MTAGGADNSTVTTEMPMRRERVFLQQSLGERLVGALWAVVRTLLFRFSPGFMNWWRVLLLKLFGAKVDASAYIAPSARIDFPWNLVVEPKAVICHQVIINCMGRVRIGKGTLVSQYGHICAGTHNYKRRNMEIVRRPIDIGADCWIAADAFVGPGVTLGDGCMLAARSSAFGDLPAGMICVGEPAEPRKARFEEADAA